MHKNCQIIIMSIIFFEWGMNGGWIRVTHLWQIFCTYMRRTILILDSPGRQEISASLPIISVYQNQPPAVNSLRHFSFTWPTLDPPINHNWQVHEHFFVALTKVILFLMINYVEKYAGNQENRLKFRLVKFGNTIYHFSYSLNKTADPHLAHGMWSATADSVRFALASLD